MNIKGIMYEMLVEEVKNKKLLNSLYQKWNSENDKVTPEMAEWIFIQYMGGTDEEGNYVQPLKDQLSLKKQEVKNFLVRFNGEFGRTKFDSNKLKDLPSYNFNQITYLLTQFGRKYKLQTEDQQYFFEKPGSSKSDWIKTSKELWFGDKFKVYDDGNGFRIYKPSTQKDSISFGFYQGYIAKTEHPNRSNKWCVTNYRPAGDSMSNLWQRYREDFGRTFYFVIDETKPKDHQYYISALQRLDRKEGQFDFKVTNASNTDGDLNFFIDNPTSPEISLKHVYPQLFQNPEWNLLDEVSSTKFDQGKEMDLDVDKLTKLLAQIREEPGEYDFVIQDPDVKRAYINAGNELHEVRSFESLNDTDLRLYFEIHLTQNPRDTFKSFAILKYLQTRGSDFVGYLTGKLKQVGVSISEIYNKLITQDYTPLFVSKQDKEIKLFHRTKAGREGDKEVGIYDLRKGDWVEYNGIKYEPVYSKLDFFFGSFDMDKKQTTDTNDSENSNPDQENLQEQGFGKSYAVTVYSKSSGENDNTNFYVVQDIINNDPYVTIFSHSTWVNSALPYFVPLTSPDYDPVKDYSDLDGNFDKNLNEKGGF